MKNTGKWILTLYLWYYKNKRQHAVQKKYWWLKSKTQNKMEWNENKQPSLPAEEFKQWEGRLMFSLGCRGWCWEAHVSLWTSTNAIVLKVPQGHFHACRRGHYLLCSGSMNKLVGQNHHNNNLKRHSPFMVLDLGLGFQKSKIFVTQYPYPLWLSQSPPN